jgi:hypothetical protein
MEQRKQSERQRAIARIKRRTEKAAADHAAWLEATKPVIGRAAIAADLAARRQKSVERARRTKRLIQLGGLVSRAGLLDLNPDVLLGALSSASKFTDDQKWADRWRQLGSRIAAESTSGEDVSPVGTAAPVTAEDIRLRRKYATQRLIVAGGIVEKAGLGQCEREVLLGILASIGDHQNDAERVSRWKAAGVVLATNAPAQVEVRFPEPISRATGLALRQLGFRFDRQNVVWLGLADLTSMSRVVKSESGVVSVDPKSGGKPGKTVRPEHSQETGKRKMRTGQRTK